MLHIAVIVGTVCASVVWTYAFLPVAVIITIALVVQGEVELRKTNTHAKEGKQ